MAAKVKCLYCGQSFDREFCEFVKIRTRYAHKDCFEIAQKEASELKKVTSLIQDLYKPQVPNWKLIGTQIQKYRDEGMTYMGMYYTLSYFFIIKENDIHKGKGVGIIPYMYDRAKAYYENVSNTYTKIADIESREEIKVSQTESIVTILKEKPKKKLLDFDY